MNRNSRLLNRLILINIILIIAILCVWLFVKKQESHRVVINEVGDMYNINYFMKNYTLALLYNNSVIDNIKFYSSNNLSNIKSIYKIPEFGALILKLNGSFCNACNKFAIDKIKEYFPNLKINKNIIFIGENIPVRLEADFYGKKILRYKDDQKTFLKDYDEPLYFYINKDGVVKFIFFPDKSYPEYTDKYLIFIKKEILKQ